MTMLTGREALLRIDAAVADLRRALGDAISAADSIESRRGAVRSEQVEAYKDLADFRLDIVSEAEPDRLTALHERAAKLLKDHEAYVEAEAASLAAASGKIAALETARAELVEQHHAAAEAYEAKVARVEASLQNDEAYRALSEAHEQADAIVARAEQKLELARKDRQEKGAPYESDALFLYLWKRRYRTPDYKAGPFIRLLDGWVARLCKYDQAYLNYDRLTELPERLAEHVARKAEKADAALDALEAAEAEALKAGGAERLQEAAEAVLERIAALDADMEAAEAEHRAIAERHASAVEKESGPAADARKLLEDGLKQASFPDLRILAAETVALDDDRLVDRLVKLRAEEMSLELEAERSARLPNRRRQDLSQVEALRRQFKSSRFDSAYARFERAHIDRAIGDVLSGAADVGRAFRQLQRSVRRIDPSPGGGFGGGRRSNTLGLPVVLGDVAWEVVKEMGRQGARTGPVWGGPRSRRRSSGVRFPSGGKRGGFRTGGRF